MADHGLGLESIVFAFASVYEITVEDSLSNARNRESGEAPPHMTAWIAHLKAPSNDCIDGCAGDHAELAGNAHGLCETPIRNCRAHTSLDDQWQMGVHCVRRISEWSVNGYVSAGNRSHAFDSGTIPVVSLLLTNS
jgi:hypothetical protein